jgi:hypothetical protein
MMLVWFSFSLITPFLFAESRSELPACCRRNGKHHCMMSQTGAAGSSGVAFRAEPEKCPVSPFLRATAAHFETPFVPASVIAVALVPIRPVKAVRSVSLHRASYETSCQKRGPPAISA